MNIKYRILVVDDVRSDLHVLYHTLRHDYDVITADSGEMAIERAVNKRPDLILLDIKLPDVSGYEVLIRLKEEKETRDIPVIFITGLADAENESKGLILGAVDYITKPLNVNIVKARVRTHLKIVEQMRKIEKLGMMDALTDIPNRRKFDQQMKVEWNKAAGERTPLALLFIDVDSFKAYNDTYGHTMGDQLLKTLSKEMEAHLTQPGDFIARMGGDEFSIILPNTDKDTAINISERIRFDIEALGITSGLNQSIPVTVSIGVAVAIPDSDGDMDEFISACDNKLYTAKKSDRNKVCG